MNDELLKKYFDFTDADLFRNRTGILTPRQQTRLVGKEKFWKKIVLFAGSFLLIVAIVPVVVIGLSTAACISNFCSEWPLSLWIFLLLMVLVWPLAWGFFGVRAIRSALSPFKFEAIKKAEGAVNIIKVESYNNTTHMEVEDYELHIGGVTFDIDSELADIMMQGDIYAVYYLEESKDIMSAELLGKGK
jgi:hypothetical protein